MPFLNRVEPGCLWAVNRWFCASVSVEGGDCTCLDGSVIAMKSAPQSACDGGVIALGRWHIHCWVVQNRCDTESNVAPGFLQLTLRCDGTDPLHGTDRLPRLFVEGDTFTLADSEASLYPLLADISEEGVVLTYIARLIPEDGVYCGSLDLDINGDPFMVARITIASGDEGCWDGQFCAEQGRPRFRLTVAGISDGDCIGCGMLNGTFDIEALQCGNTAVGGNWGSGEYCLYVGDTIVADAQWVFGVRCFPSSLAGETPGELVIMGLVSNQPVLPASGGASYGLRAGSELKVEVPGVSTFDLIGSTPCCVGWPATILLQRIG